MILNIKKSDILIETAKAKFIKLNDERGFWIPSSLVKNDEYIAIPDGFKVTTKAIEIDTSLMSIGGDAKINILNSDDIILTEDMIEVKKEALKVEKIEALYYKELKKAEKEHIKNIKNGSKGFFDYRNFDKNFGEKYKVEVFSSNNGKLNSIKLIAC